MKSKLLRGFNQYRKTRKRTSTLRLKLALAMSGIVLTVVGYHEVMQPHWETVYIKPVQKAYAAEKPLYTEDLIETEGRNFLRRIRILESSNGQNTNPDALHNICKAQGKVNTIGYGGMQGINGELFCFANSEQEAGKVMSWYREHRETMTEREAYCTWNVGVKTEDCNYWREAQAL